jgi:hypothetical protein
MLGFARNCGWALALAHAKSGDPAIIAGYIGKGSAFANAIARFADAYMNQNLADYARMGEAIKAGTIKVLADH